MDRGGAGDHKTPVKVEAVKTGANVQFAKKQKSGVESESRISVLTNVWGVYPKTNLPFYRYDFSVGEEYPGKEPDKPRVKEVTKRSRDDYQIIERKNKCVVVFTMLLEREQGFFHSPQSYVYDRASILYSLDKLQIKQGEERKFFIKRGELPEGIFPEECTRVVVSIKPCVEDFVVTAKDFKSCLSPCPQKTNRALQQFYELLLSQEAFFTEGRFVSYGAGESYLLRPEDFGFSERDAPGLPEGKYVGVGASKGVKLLEGRGNPTLSVCLDVKKAAFHVDNQNLAEKAAMICNSRAIGDPIDPRHSKTLKKILKGLYVRCCYGKYRTFQVNDLLNQNAETLRIQIGNELVTVNEYYKTKYNIDLKYKGLPLVIECTSKGINYYPMEVLEVCENQRVLLTQQSSNQVQRMIRACATPPVERLKQIRNVTRAMKLDKEGCENRWLAEFDMKIDKQNMQVVARVLRKPNVVYGSGVTMHVRDTGTWTITANTKFLIPQKCDLWCCYALVTQNDNFDGRAFESYISCFLTRCRQRGMVMKEPVDVSFKDRVSEDDIDKCFKAAIGKSAKFIHFITSESLKYHERMKYLESQHQILTQDLLSETASAAPHKSMTLDNIVNKTNLKLGGLNFELHLTSQAAQKWFTTGDRLVIGYDLSFVSAVKGEKGLKAPSVIGYSSNCQRHPLSFIGGYRYAFTVREELCGEETAVTDLVVESLQRAKKNRKIPTHIVILRDGVSEGQYRYILEKEIEDVKKGCLRAGGRSYQPQITFVVATKMHNMRLFRTVINARDRPPTQNIPAGTVVDSGVVSGQLTEFYLNSHVALQGTAKTPRYDVLFDTSNMSSDEVQGLTFALCFNLQIVSQACSLPAPLMIADAMASRGRSNFSVFCGTADNELKDIGDLEHLNEQLGYMGKPLAECRFNA